LATIVADDVRRLWKETEVRGCRLES